MQSNPMQGLLNSNNVHTVGIELILVLLVLQTANEMRSIRVLFFKQISIALLKPCITKQSISSEALLVTLAAYM